MVSGCFNTTLGATWRSLPTDLQRARIVTRRIILSKTLSPVRYCPNSSNNSSLLRTDFSQAANSCSQAGSGPVSRRPKVAATCLTARSLVLPDGELGIAVLQNNRCYLLDLLIADARMHGQ